MRKNSFHTIVQWTAVIFVLILFCYFRIKPIIFQTVPYTYDQGRDFLKAEEIVRFKNPTFIGPTTGAQGLPHRAWWYYFLSIVFFIFNGWPLGFYYGIFAFTLISIFLFFLFLKKEFSFWTAFLFLLIVTVSPYFIRISFFPANNILTPSAVLLLIYATYMFFKTNKPFHLGLIGLALGMITETEFSFGTFIIPSFFLLCFFFKDFRQSLKNKQSVLFFIIGLGFPFLPRILFNLKNHFIEITGTLHFLKTTPPTNPTSLTGAIGARVNLFVKYYLDVVYDHNVEIALALAAGMISTFILGYKKLKPHVTKSTIFLFIIMILTFAVSLINKNNFFWDNYIEGIHYIQLYIILMGFEGLLHIKKLSRISYLIVGAFLILNVILFFQQSRDKKPIPDIGLRADMMTVNYIYNQTNNKNFCVRIYTPPIVPYTYNYLFSYDSKVLKYQSPSTDFVDNSCWFILDKESYVKRVEEWRKANTPENAKLIKTHTMPNGATVELWKM